MFLSTFIPHLTQLLFPKICVLCGNKLILSKRICAPCLIDLPTLPKHCHQCGQFLTQDAHFNLKCRTCLIEPPSFDRILALFPYQPPIKQLISELKFHQQLIYAHLFSELLFDQIKTRWYRNQPLPSIIIPVPLHPKRLRERGYNQTLEIAKPLAKSLRIPLHASGLIRHKSTQPQSGLSKRKRAQNVSQAFKVYDDFTNHHVALLDDVVTTGFTISECCKLLKAHHAKQIDVWCCARRS